MYFFFQAEDGIRDLTVTGVQTCALPISKALSRTAVVLPRGIPSSLFRMVASDRASGPTCEAAAPRASEVWRESRDRKSTRLNSSHSQISYAVFCLKKKKQHRSRHATS